MKILDHEYFLEFTFFRKIRQFKDGITFFDFHINLDLYEADHNPKFDIFLMILNYKIFEFNIYTNTHYWDENWRD